MAALVPDDAEVLAGIELGGVPLVVALSAATGLPAAFLRRAPKRYGTRRQAEDAEVDGRRVVLVDDVVRSGGQPVPCQQLVAGGAGSGSNTTTTRTSEERPVGRIDGCCPPGSTSTACQLLLPRPPGPASGRRADVVSLGAGRVAVPTRDRRGTRRATAELDGRRSAGSAPRPAD
nr:phosphoribosyltransferase family protein [Streptomyces mobaraensis]